MARVARQLLVVGLLDALATVRSSSCARIHLTNPTRVAAFNRLRADLCPECVGHRPLCHDASVMTDKDTASCEEGIPQPPLVVLTTLKAIDQKVSAPRIGRHIDQVEPCVC